MFSINGITLDNPARGWVVLNSSDTTAGANMSRPSLSRPGEDGTTPMPGTLEAPALGVVVGCRRSTLEALRSVFLQPTLNLGRLGTPGTAVVELRDLSPAIVGTGPDPDMELKAVLSFPGVWFRGPVETFGVGPGFDSSTTELDCFPGISGKITDALIRVTDVPSFRVTDSAGSFIQYADTVPAGTGLRIDTATGRGWLAAPWDWTGGTEVDPLALSFGRGPGFLTITPTFTDPDDRTGRLTISVGSGARTGSTLEVQGRNAHNV